MVNNVSIFGRVTKDLEVKKTQSGKSVLNFNLAVNRDKEHTDFIPCQAWEKRADTIAKYVRKGDQLAVSGHIQSNSYQQQDGTNRTFINVLVGDFSLVSKPKEQQYQQSYQSTQTVEQPQYDITAEDLPF